LRNRKSALPNFLFLSLNPYFKVYQKDVLITVSFLKVFSFSSLPIPPSPLPLPSKPPIDKAFHFCPKGQLTKSSKIGRKPTLSLPIARRFSRGIQHSASQTEKSTEVVVEMVGSLGFLQLVLIDRKNLTKSIGF
jgi:hypothetical protein